MTKRKERIILLKSSSRITYPSSFSFIHFKILQIRQPIQKFLAS